ncbi:MAG: hypothetical protein IT378_25835 [Sandaracinaceae bacterium]|nr:hypothetical protein [Sandaracinaceae bacterium]
MSSRAHGSEEALARVACERIRNRKNTCVLVGGLGLGFTLRAALDALGPDGRVVVAELIGALVEWCREGPAAEVAKRPLDDPRVEVVIGDVWEALGPRAFDAILLDVDNGPDAFTVASNARLYGPRGLRALAGALRDGGVLALWAEARSERFERALRQSRLRFETTPARAGGRRGARHVIYLVEREA